VFSGYKSFSTAGFPVTSACTILLIEDDAPYRAMIRRLLASRGVSGEHLCEAADIEHGLRLLNTGRFDLVLLDHTLPHGTALDGLRAVRAQHPKLPIIIHTGYLSPEHQSNALAEGANEVVIKGAFSPLWAAMVRVCPQLGPPPQEGPRAAVGRTVLVAEDDEGVRTVVERTLREEGYGVVVAEHGKRALELLATLPQAVDLIFADVRMPEMGGAELGRILAQTRADLPIIYSTGWPEELNPATSRLGPNATMLPKPFNPATLLRAVEAVFKRAGSERQ
jgi:CheY-like chemotaxis protein